MGPHNLLPQFELCIITLYDEANFIIETFDGDVIREGSTTSSSPLRLILPRNLEVVYSRIDDRNKGLRVRATGQNPISVLSSVVYPFISVFGIAAYLIHINSEVEDQNSYEYFALSTDYAGNPVRITNRRSAILLVGNYNSTNISITPTQNISLPQDIQIFGAVLDIAIGSTYDVILNSLQTLLITSMNDLTGTRIVSNQPLTVITGHQCAQVPVTNGFCEPLFVHIPPIVHWGQEFFLGPFAGRNTTQYYKLVSSKDYTVAAYRCGHLSSRQTTEISESGSSVILEIPPDSFCYLTATYPVFIVQMGAGFTVDGLGDPAIAVVSPTFGHVKRTQFKSLLNNSFITVTVQVEHYNASDILLDGDQLDCNWIAIYHIDLCHIVGYGCTANVSAMAHTVMHSGENGSLSVTVYGWDDRPAMGYAYLTGINLEG